jgi:cysteine-S-conjugate beta-lyase
MHYNFDTLFDRRATECYKWNYYPDDVLPLPVADMDFISPQPVIDALQHRVSHGIFGYPEWGNPKSSTLICLYEVIAERMQRLYGWEVKPEELVFFPGVVAGLNLACSALSGSDIGVLIQPPVYPPFLHLADNAGAFLQEAQLALRPDGSYEIDWNAFEAAFTPQTKIFVLCNPHNPVGRVFRKDELERMASLCLEHGVTILSDEIHCDLLFSGQNHIPIASLNPEIAQNAITLMAPSKTFNLAGLFCSFAVIQNPELRQRFRKVQESRSAAVNVLGLVAAEAAFTRSAALPPAPGWRRGWPGTARRTARPRSRTASPSGSCPDRWRVDLGVVGAGDLPDGEGDGPAQQDADDAADQAEHRRFGQELHQDVALAARPALCAGRSRGCARSPKPA